MRCWGGRRRLRRDDADDFVICCRGHAGEAVAGMRRMMTRLKLTGKRLVRFEEREVETERGRAREAPRAGRRKGRTNTPD